MTLCENFVGGMILEGVVDWSLYQLYASNSFLSLGVMGYTFCTVLGIGGFCGALRDAKTRKEFFASVATGVGALLMCGLLHRPWF